MERCTVLNPIAAEKRNARPHDYPQPPLCDGEALPCTIGSLDARPSMPLGEPDASNSDSDVADRGEQYEQTTSAMFCHLTTDGDLAAEHGTRVLYEPGSRRAFAMRRRGRKGACQATASASRQLVPFQNGGSKEAKVSAGSGGWPGALRLKSISVARQITRTPNCAPCSHPVSPPTATDQLMVWRPRNADATPGTGRIAIRLSWSPRRTLLHASSRNRARATILY